MPRIIIQTIPRGGDRPEVTLSERITSANIDDPHYAAQLTERLAWATADAQAIESQARLSEQAEDAPSVALASHSHHVPQREIDPQTATGITEQWYDVTTQAFERRATRLPEERQNHA